MSYKDDINEIYNLNEKIPYDSTPISRKKEHRQKSSEGRGHVFQRNSSPLTTKILVALVAVLFAFNIVLAGVVIWSVGKGGPKYINVYESSIEVSGSADINEYAYQKAWYNSVCIGAGGRVTDYNSFFSSSRSRGSGVILSKNDEQNVLYVLTCQHVIDGYEKSINILFPSYLKPVSASVVGYSVLYDIAVLKVTNLNNLEACTDIDVSDSQTLGLGESIFAVGNAISGGLSITRGIVSRQNCEINVDGNTRREIQIDAPINPGNSGGGLFNAEGKFVGLVNAKLNSVTSSGVTQNVEGTAYAIPGTLAIGVAASIIKNDGYPTNVNIGVNFAADKSYPVSTVEVDKKLINNYRVIVSGVSYGADASGVLRKNDEIVSFTYWSILDNEQHTVLMLNEYCFEDISFLVVPGSNIEFMVRSSLSEDARSVVVTARTTTTQK